MIGKNAFHHYLVILLSLCTLIVISLHNFQIYLIQMDVPLA